MSIIEPSLDELLKKVNSRYVLVVAAAKRARQIEAANGKTVEKELDEPTLSSLRILDIGDGNMNEKAVTQALREIAEGRLEVRMGKTQPGDVKKDKIGQEA